MKLKPIINSFDLQKRVLELAKSIEKDYEEVYVIGLLNGAFMFVGDLTKHINKNVYVDFMKVHSYVGDTSSNLKVICDITADIKAKDVLVVDDILDTGKTLFNIMNILKGQNPKSLKLCVLLDKPSRRKIDIKADYVGFEIEDKFVVGYGLDYRGFGRNLNFIAEIDPNA